MPRNLLIGRKFLKKYLEDYAFLFLVAGVLIFVDQVTKEWVRNTLPYGNVLRPDLWLSQYVRIVHVKNTGAAFGMFQSLGDVFMVLSFVVAGVIIYYFPRIPRPEWTTRLALSMLLGGAVGNLIDRLMHGHVTDFISVLNIPVFNVADASISTGVVVLFLGTWLQERRERSAARGDDSAEDESGNSSAENGAEHPYQAPRSNVARNTEVEQVE